MQDKTCQRKLYYVFVRLKEMCFVLCKYKTVCSLPAQLAISFLSFLYKRLGLRKLSYRLSKPKNTYLRYPFSRGF